MKIWTGGEEMHFIILCEKVSFEEGLGARHFALTFSSREVPTGSLGSVFGLLGVTAG